MINFRSFGYRPVSIIGTLCSIIVHLEFSLRYHFTTYRSFDQEQERDACALATMPSRCVYMRCDGLKVDRCKDEEIDITTVKE